MLLLPTRATKLYYATPTERYGSGGSRNSPFLSFSPPPFYSTNPSNAITCRGAMWQARIPANVVLPGVLAVQRVARMWQGVALPKQHLSSQVLELRRLVRRPPFTRLGKGEFQYITVEGKHVVAVEVLIRHFSRRRVKLEIFGLFYQVRGGQQQMSCGAGWE